jgi:hypothetical protein
MPPVGFKPTIAEGARPLGRGGMRYDAHNMCRKCTTAQQHTIGIIHGNQFGYSNQTLRWFISNLATTGNTWRTATKESAKQQAANRGPKLPTLWKVFSGQQ